MIKTTNNYEKPTASHCIWQSPWSICPWPHGAFKLEEEINSKLINLKKINKYHLLKIIKNTLKRKFHSINVQFSSVPQLCLTLCNPIDSSTPGLPVHHQLQEFTHVHWVSDAIQPSHPLLSPSPPALNVSQHHSLFKWVSSSNQVAKVLEFQLQHQSFQWILRTDL